VSERGEAGRESEARLHFHVALAGVLLSFAAPLISWALALLHRQDRPGPWKRRLFGLAIADTALAVAVGVATLSGVDLGAAAREQDHVVDVAAEQPVGEEAARPPLFEPIDPATERRLQPAERSVMLASAALDLVLLVGLLVWARARRAPVFPGLSVIAGLAALAAISSATLLAFRATLGVSYGAMFVARLAGSAGLLVTSLALVSAGRRRTHSGPVGGEEAVWGAPLPTGNAIGLGVLYGIAGAARIGVVVMLLSALFGLPVKGAAEAFDLNVAPAGLVLFGVTAVIVAPIGEELLFRGILVPWLSRWMHPWSALGWSALIFAAGHAYYGAAAAVLFHYGLVLGWARLRTGRLWASIALHALLNGTTTAVLLARALRG
jgi:uncharacterized protein